MNLKNNLLGKVVSLDVIIDNIIDKYHAILLEKKEQLITSEEDLCISLDIYC